MTRILAFGVFDLLHPGHLAFLRQAKPPRARKRLQVSFLEAELVVAITRDDVAKQEKGRRPRLSVRERMELVAGVRWVDRVVMGDPPERYFSVIRRLKPDIIALGYDQPCDIPAFRKTLRSLGLPHTRIVRLKEYKGHRYHSSRLVA